MAISIGKYIDDQQHIWYYAVILVLSKKAKKKNIPNSDEHDETMNAAPYVTIKQIENE